MAKVEKARQPSTGKRGARREYDRGELVPIICARLAAHDTQGLEPILRELGIPVETVRDWRKTDPAIAAQFDEARDRGYDAIAHRTRATARGNGDSTKDVQRDKLIIDTDLKLLAKWDPRRYGDKMQHSNDPDNPLPAPQFIIQPIATKAPE